MAYTQSVLEQQLKSGDRAQQGGWPWRLLLLSGIIFLTTIAIYAGMQFGLSPYLSGQSKSVDQQINKLSGAISADEVNNFSAFYSQLNNIQNLLADHAKSSDVTDFLEKNTLTNVYFKTMSLDWSTRTLKFDGNAPSYSVLSQQMEIFRQAPQISEVNLDGANLSQDKTGGVDFSIRLILK